MKRGGQGFSELCVVTIGCNSHFRTDVDTEQGEGDCWHRDTKVTVQYGKEGGP